MSDVHLSLWFTALIVSVTMELYQVLAIYPYGIHLLFLILYTSVYCILPFMVVEFSLAILLFRLRPFVVQAASVLDSFLQVCWSSMYAVTSCSKLAQLMQVAVLGGMP